MNISLLALSGVQTVSLWLSVAVVAAVLICGVAVFCAKRTAFAAYVKYAVTGVVTYAAALGLIVLAVTYEDAIISAFGVDMSGHFSEKYPIMVVAPVCATVALCAATIVLAAVYERVGGYYKIAAYCFGTVAAIFTLVTVFTTCIYFGDAVEFYNDAAGETLYAADVAEHVILWLTLPLVAFAAAANTAQFFIDRARFVKSLKITLTTAVFYAAAMGITMLVLSIVKSYSASYAEENWLAREQLITYVFVPLIVLCAVAIIAAATVLLVYKFKPARAKLAARICGAAFVLVLIAAAVLIGLYYTGTIKGDGYYDDSEAGAKVNDLALYLLAAGLIVIAVVGALIIGRKDQKQFDTRSISYAAVCIALSFALSYIRPIHLPQGGSVTPASLLPLMIYSYMFGVKKGVFACFIYGILQAVQDPWIIHPAQFLLDYPVAFSFIGFAGMFAKVKRLEKVPQVKFALGAIIASAFRFISHVFSGVFAFSAYAIDAGMAAWPYSLAYNSFVFADIAIAIVVGVLVFSSRNFVKFISRFNTQKNAAAPAVKSGKEAEAK